MDRILDWRSHHDERSRNFPVTALLAATPRRRRLWYPPVERIDQGREGACVGFAWTIELLASPVRARLGYDANEFALNVYRAAQRIDEWPGENYSGTSVLAGAKIVQQLGLIESYHWAFGIDDVIDTLVSFGPVVLGIPWYESMYTTDANGLVTVSGRKVGGHAITVTGYTRRRFNGVIEDVVRWRNSWGATYGKRGDGYIRVDDLAKLLADDGEACVPVGRRHA
jgi:hypothetical protein